MEVLCGCTGNKDLEPFLPAVVEAAQSISNTHSCVEKLAGCIFVQNVEAPALACTLPVLSRGLNDKSEEVKRTCCLIVDNMCKLVEDPAAVVPIMPRLEPLVRAATEQIADPEARGMAEKAYKTLAKSAEGAELKAATPAEVEPVLRAAAGESVGDDEASSATLAYVAALAATAANMRSFDAEGWAKDVGFLRPTTASSRRC